jgi:SAM-dependent methyltransferase
LRYGLDAPGGQGPFRYSPGQEIAIRGWAFLAPQTDRLPPLAVDVVGLQTGSHTSLNVRRLERPDVARHFGFDSLTAAGFECWIRLDHRFQGQCSVRVSQKDGAGTTHSADLFSFTVAPAIYETHVRRELAARFLAGSGLEIGALQRQLEVPEHCAVTYVDRMSLSELLVHYPELRGQPIQAPDLIEDGETLATIGAGSQDFVVANHFLEHCENPIQTILNMTRVLKEDGILYMAVPDKRFTFDVDRPVTRYSVLAETFETGRRPDREALYSEWAALVNHVAPAEVASAAENLVRSRYSIHFNVWTLQDLLEFLGACRLEFDLPFVLEWVVSSENEVIVILSKRSNAPSLDT